MSLHRQAAMIEKRLPGTTNFGPSPRLNLAASPSTPLALARTGKAGRRARLGQRLVRRARPGWRPGWLLCPGQGRGRWARLGQRLGSQDRQGWRLGWQTCRGGRRLVIHGQPAKAGCLLWPRQQNRWLQEYASLNAPRQMMRYAATASSGRRTTTVFSAPCDVVR
ncbi:hypothetical protein HaLaN_16358 [Haematococcus lacustris]|uniref:Uncharacterized protein n=1 Tax=Haematococcus lacustris TaxID=44745 RepID=A0A699ZKT6_HAELA|nr:hypothetical protein HaLaN_16358 [Haematococcus lacustris]